jgi:hypothetical protein
VPQPRTGQRVGRAVMASPQKWLLRGTVDGNRDGRPRAVVSQWPALKAWAMSGNAAPPLDATYQ